MKNYLDFTAIDFAEDEKFLKWVKHPNDPGLHDFWENWLRHHPHKREEVEEARYLVQAILLEKYVPTEKEQQEVWESIHRVVREDRNPQEVRWRNTTLARAAVVLITLGVGWAVWQLIPDKASTLAEAPAKTEVVQIVERQLNTGMAPKTVILPDGTSIVLQPQSELRYAKQFSDSLREVHLTGEAFFEVKKDPTRPFLVHTNEIVTRVIGTTFTVRNFKDENIIVQVKTGKVSVFKQKDKADKDPLVDGVVLTPNQQVEYARNKMTMTKSLVENPSLLLPVTKLSFEFSDTPVVEVFDLIEDAYGVDIIYDRETMVNCRLNASLSDVPLNDKIKVICKAIQTTYEVIDSKIIIYGQPCAE